MKLIQEISVVRKSRNASETGSRRRKEADSPSNIDPEVRLASAATRARQRGSAGAVLLVMPPIMLILVAANGNTLLHLQKELRFIERQQTLRLNAAQTNAVVVVPPPGVPAPPEP